MLHASRFALRAQPALQPTARVQQNNNPGWLRRGQGVVRYAQQPGPSCKLLEIMRTFVVASERPMPAAFLFPAVHREIRDRYVWLRGGN